MLNSNQARRITWTLAILAATIMAHRPARGQDPSGDFVAMLNQARAARGLAPVAHDPAAVPTAAANNAAQATYGLGHWTTNGYGQVAAVGMPNAQAAFAAWCGSPGHAAILFAPDLVSVGYHQAGGCCTAATRQGGYAIPAPQPAGWYYPSPGATWAICPAGATWYWPASGGRWRRWR